MLKRKLSRANPAVWSTTLNFYVLSIFAALLVGMGQRSTAIPSLVIVCAVLAIVNTDWLGWFRIHPYVSYIGMIIGAVIAIVEFWYGRQVEQLFAVANLLVYVQLPIYFQKKHHRLFEHWGVFLMLEFIVASLLNDNVLFGIMLILVAIIGTAAMMMLSSFVSGELAGTSGPEASGGLAKFLRWMGQEHSMRCKGTGIIMTGISQPVPKDNPQRYLGWIRSFPIGLSIIPFALVYFFALPRLHTGAYEGLGRGKAAVGFSGSVSLDDVGELMSNNDIALRMTISDPKTDRNYHPTEPPYIRGVVVPHYQGNGSWQTIDQFVGYRSHSLEKLFSINQLRREMRDNDQFLRVDIQEQSYFGATQFSIPPFCRSNSDLAFIPHDWRIVDVNRRSQDNPSPTKRRYSFETNAFLSESRQTPFLIEASACLNPDSDRTANSGIGITNYETEYNSQEFQGLGKVTDEVLSKNPKANNLEKAILLEDYLANSGDFSYSLLPAVNRMAHIDPIEDFVVNHRTGHCQYFSSALAMMLRSAGIPTRIVLGFRPSEFNDVGKYFVVRQRHAHAWVEAYIPTDDFKNDSLVIPKWAGDGVWLRLDPTPPGEGSNAGGSLKSASGQTLEVVQQLWKDLVMDLDRTNQPEAITFYGATGNNAIGVVMRTIERFVLKLQTRNLGGDELAADRWFSWQAGIAAMALGAVGFVVIRMPKIIRLFKPGRREGSRSKNLARSPALAFLRRTMNALGKFGLRREPHQTPLEFARVATQWLDSRNFDPSKRYLSLADLTNDYYRLRFGSEIQLTANEVSDIEETIQALERFAVQSRPK